MDQASLLSNLKFGVKMMQTPSFLFLSSILYYEIFPQRYLRAQFS